MQVHRSSGGSQSGESGSNPSTRLREFSHYAKADFDRSFAGGDERRRDSYLAQNGIIFHAEPLWNLRGC